MDLDAQDHYNGLTALHDALLHGHRDAARALTEAGAGAATCTRMPGISPHGLALSFDYAEIAATVADDGVHTDLEAAG